MYKKAKLEKESFLMSLLVAFAMYTVKLSQETGFSLSSSGENSLRFDCGLWHWMIL